MKDRKKKISKFLAYILRHHPENVNASLNDKGFLDISIEELAERMSKKRDDLQISSKDIKEVVKNDEKGRYEIKSEQIRALYGHSKKVNKLTDTLKSGNLPKMLYHGSPTKNKKSILEKGLKSMNREFVHLTSDKQTAIETAQRRSKSIIVFKINTRELIEKGFEIKKAGNQIYLTEAVPPEIIEIFSTKE